MSSDYAALPLSPLEPGTRFVCPAEEMPEKLSADSPALDAMTDLRRVAAVTVDPSMPIDAALDRMKHSGVRLLLVINTANQLIGLITARDIQGERPLRFEESTGVRRGEVRVKDIMTPQDQLRVLHMRDVARACVGDVIMSLRLTGRQHALVVESGVDGAMLRGIFSASRIERLLGEGLVPSGLATTFAELQAALLHS